MKKIYLKKAYLKKEAVPRKDSLFSCQNMPGKLEQYSYALIVFTRNSAVSATA